MAAVRAHAYAPRELWSDNDLAAAAREGDAEALELLLRRNVDRIHGICRRITCHSEDAHDATQEALVAIYRHIATFDGRCAFATWMYRVAVNAALGEVRRRGRRPLPLADPDSWRLAAEVRGQGPASAEVHRIDQHLDVDAALTQLAPEFRAAVVLRDLCDLDYPTIGEVLGLPQGTVRSRIHRGRVLLAALLREQRP